MLEQNVGFEVRRLLTKELGDLGNKIFNEQCDELGIKAEQIKAGDLTLISTRMACPPDTLDGPFMRDLQRVSSFFVEDGHLYLELPMDSGTMKFRPAP